MKLYCKTIKDVASDDTVIVRFIVSPSFYSRQRVGRGDQCMFYGSVQKQDFTCWFRNAEDDRWTRWEDGLRFITWFFGGFGCTSNGTK